MPATDPAALPSEAAALMREHATKATSGFWQIVRSNGGLDTVEAVAPCAHPSWNRHVAFCEDGNADHIASWHPGVALAVAALLDAAAAEIDSAGKNGLIEDGDGCWNCGSTLDDGCGCWPLWIRALAVARAYLGRTDE